MYAEYCSERDFRERYSHMLERWLGDPRSASNQRELLSPFSYGHRRGGPLSFMLLRMQLV